MSKPRYSDGLAVSPPLSTGFPGQPVHSHAPPPSPGWDPRDEVDVTVVAYPKAGQNQSISTAQSPSYSVPQQSNISIPNGTAYGAGASQQGLRITLDDYFPIERLQPSSTVLASPAFPSSLPTSSGIVSNANPIPSGLFAGSSLPPSSGVVSGAFPSSLLTSGISFPTSSGVVSNSFPSGLLTGSAFPTSSGVVSSSYPSGLLSGSSVVNLNQSTTTGPSPLGFFGIPSATVTTSNWGNVTSFPPAQPLNISTISSPSLGVDPSLLPLSTKPIFSTAQPSNFGLPPQITPNYSQSYVPPTNFLPPPTPFPPTFQPSFAPPTFQPPTPSSSGFTVGPRPPQFGSIPGPSIPPFNPNFGPAYRPPPAGFAPSVQPFGAPLFSARPQQFGPAGFQAPQPPKFLPTTQFGGQFSTPPFGGQYVGPQPPFFTQQTNFSQFGNQFSGFSAPPLALPATSARGPNDFLLDLDISKYTQQQQFSSQLIQNPGTFTTSTTSFTTAPPPPQGFAGGPTFPLPEGQAFTQNPDGSWSGRSTTELQKSLDNNYTLPPTSAERSESPSPSTNREFLSAVDQYGKVGSGSGAFFGSQNSGLVSGRSDLSAGVQSGYSQGGPSGGVSSLGDVFGNRPVNPSGPNQTGPGSVASQGPSYSNNQQQGLGGILSNIGGAPQSGSQIQSSSQGFPTGGAGIGSNEQGLGGLLSGSVASQGPTSSHSYQSQPQQQQHSQNFQSGPPQQHQQNQSSFGGAFGGAQGQPTFNQGPSASVSSNVFNNGPVSNYGSQSGNYAAGNSVLSQSGYGSNLGASVVSQIPGQGPQYRLPSLNRSDLGSISRIGNPLLGSTGSVHPLNVGFDDSLANDELLQYRLATLEREVDRLRADDEALRRKIANPNLTSPHQNLLREKEALISKIKEEERRWAIERQARESDMHRYNEEAERLKQQQAAYEQMRLAEAQYQAGSTQGVAAWNTPASAKKKKKKTTPKSTKSPKKSPKRTAKSPKK